MAVNVDMTSHALRFLRAALPLGGLLAAAACGPAPQLADAAAPVQRAPVEGAMAGEEWSAFGHDPGGSQFSPLAEITPANVRKLKVAWRHKSGDFRSSPSVKVGTSLQVTPIYANGRLYYCTPLNRVFALDPTTGTTRWVFDPFSSEGDGAPVSREGQRLGACRGVAYWRSSDPAETGLCAKRIFRGDRNGRLYAMDADTGRPCRGFGPPAHPGYVTHADYDNFGDPGGPIGIGTPPAVIDDTVVVGIASNDGKRDAGDGMVRAFDARTGALKWEFDPIPEPYRHATGAANVWSTISVDPKNKLVFLPTTSPSTDYDGGARKMPLPLTNAIVALHADTGEVAWSFQVVRHDLWDYDLPSHPVLVKVVKDGRPQDVAIQLSKTGHLFIFDRTTGRPAFPIRETPVPASSLPGEAAAPTQPIPAVDTFTQTHLSRERLFGIFGLDKLWCQKQFDKTRYQGLFTPPGLDDYMQFPSTLGGGNWGGAAFDPSTNSLILKSSNLATRLRLTPKAPGGVEQANVDFMTRPLEGPHGITGSWFLSPLGIPCTPPPFGQLTSIDMGTGKVRWSVPLGQPHRFNLTAPEFLNWGSPNIGGPMVTAGGLVFFSGTMDSHVRAFDVRTGRQVWKSKLAAPGMATPMTFKSGGRQYVVVAAGGSALMGTRQSDEIVAYALP